MRQPGSGFNTPVGIGVVSGRRGGRAVAAASFDTFTGGLDWIGNQGADWLAGGCVPAGVAGESQR